MLAASNSTQSSPQTPRQRHVWPWILLAVLLSVILWVTFSSNPFAQGLREIGGDKPDQSVLERTFLLAPRGFRYYTFSLAGGSSHVALVGEFTAAPEGNKSVTHSDGPENAENGVELLVLSEAAFAAWQTGGSATAVYNSGRVSHANVHADLPTGAGIYYVVFSNKFPAASATNLRASLWLHVSSWLPEWMRRSSKRAGCFGFLCVLSRPSWFITVHPKDTKVHEGNTGNPLMNWS